VLTGADLQVLGDHRSAAHADIQQLVAIPDGVDAGRPLGTCSLGQSWKRWSGPVSNSCTARLLGRMLTDLLTRASASSRDRLVQVGIGKRRSSCSGTPQQTRGYAARKVWRG
jgi:hypothetical protein